MKENSQEESAGWFVWPSRHYLLPPLADIMITTDLFEVLTYLKPALQIRQHTGGKSCLGWAILVLYFMKGISDMADHYIVFSWTHADFLRAKHVLRHYNKISSLQGHIEVAPKCTSGRTTFPLTDKKSSSQVLHIEIIT